MSVSPPVETDPAAAAKRPPALPVWCIVAAFGAYFCSYGFRKPFVAATYAETDVWGIGLKTFFVTAQVLGYMLSKFVGIKVIAELRAERRVVGLLGLMAAAQATWLGFALVPAPASALFVFLNGLVLGMVFGLVLGFLEGRTVTEALTAGLCASFILADGVVKSVGAELLARGVPEHWMPFAAGLIFTAPLLLFVAMLARIPPPDADDVAERTERRPMDRAARRAFLKRHGLGLSLLVLVHLLVTILRSTRADFAPEIWQGLGHSGQPSVFTRSETLVMFGVVILNGLSILIRDNRRAFFAGLALSLGGLALVVAAVLGRRAGMGGFPFMVLVGLGLYLPYVAMHTTLFERLIAMTRDPGTIGFLLYLADAVGYLGYIAVMLARAWGNPQGDFVVYFSGACLIGATLAALAVALCGWAFGRGPAPAHLAPALACDPPQPTTP